MVPNLQLGLDGTTCKHCFQGLLKESTTTYTSHGTAYKCTSCNRTTYGTYSTTTSTGEDPTSNEPEKKKESWFDRDKKEKNFLNLRKKKRKR